MQTVSAALKKRVNDRILECANKVIAAYGKAPTGVTVKYDIDSIWLSGQAIGSHTMRLNPVYLNAHTDHYIEQTVGHEYAHLAVNYIFGTQIKKTWGRSGVRMKREFHGPAWRAMMDVIGIPADRCHKYEAPEGTPSRQKTKHHYECSGCKEILVVGPKHHSSLQKGRTFVHKACHSKITSSNYIGTVGKVSYTEAKEMAASAAALKLAAPSATPVAPKPSAGTKMDQCYHWFKYYMASPVEGSTHRQICISIFVQEVGMSAASASTYYNNCRKMYEQD